MAEPIHVHDRSKTYLRLGIALPLIGIAIYAIQVSMARLTMPWYLPVMGTLGAVLILLAIFKRRAPWRIAALILIGLLAAAEWGFLAMTRLPPYTGPVAVGTPFPTFTTQKSDGTPLTQSDLQGSIDNIFVFFRGRW